MTPSVGIILQARMSSTRLPGKVLMPIAGVPLLGHAMARARRLSLPVAFVVATTSNAGDDAVAAFCAAQGADCFRGSEANVLERYYLCAQARNFSHIMRLTGDNPFADVAELDRLIDLHLSEAADFTHSFGALPVGVGAEIFTFAALEESRAHGKQPHHLEHVDEYLLENPALFKTKTLDVPAAKRRPDVRLTVDTEYDYRKACFIAGRAGATVSTEEAIALCADYDRALH